MKTIENKRTSNKHALPLVSFSRVGLVLAVISLLGFVVLASDRYGVAETAGVAATAVARTGAQSTTGAVPPAGVDVAGFDFTATGAISETIIAGVPAYLDHHGSGPTAAGMVIGYWDSNGYDDLIPGDAFTQTVKVNEAIASEEGTSNHYTDYCEPRDDGGPIIFDRSEYPPGDEHPDECIADYMKTSQSAYTNWYGHSWYTHVGPALRNYLRQALGARNYAGVTTNLQALDGTLNWDNFRAEIDAGRPLVLLVDTSGLGDRRFITAVGYGTDDTTQYYACYNSWDQELHWYEFTLLSDQPWSISHSVAFEIVELDSSIFLPLVMRN